MDRAKQIFILNIKTKKLPSITTNLLQFYYNLKIKKICRFSQTWHTTYPFVPGYGLELNPWTRDGQGNANIHWHPLGAKHCIRLLVGVFRVWIKFYDTTAQELLSLPLKTELDETIIHLVENLKSHLYATGFHKKLCLSARMSNISISFYKSFLGVEAL